MGREETAKLLAIVSTQTRASSTRIQVRSSMVLCIFSSSCPVFIITLPHIIFEDYPIED